MKYTQSLKKNLWVIIIILAFALVYWAHLEAVADYKSALNECNDRLVMASHQYYYDNIESPGNPVYLINSSIFNNTKR
jgi:hypothetical protein